MKGTSSIFSTVAIIGAGPGGIATAIQLAKMGIESVVLERHTFPRKKVCGDILTSNVIRAVHGISPELHNDLLAAPWTHQLNASTFGGQSGHTVEVPFNSPSNIKMGLPSCLSARRIHFDAFLVAYASQFPEITLMENYGVGEVERISDGFVLKRAGAADRIRCSYLIAATGANSPLVRALIPGQKLSPKHSAVGVRAYYEDVGHPDRPDLSEFYLLDRKLMPGGLYITPFGDGQANVNVVMRYDLLHKRKINLRALMQDYISTHPALKDRFGLGRQIQAPEGCTLYFGTRRRPISTEGCLLVGDAAGLTDATNANGIGHAMISGKIAAETVHIALLAERRDHRFLKQYDTRVYKRLKNALLPGKVMRYLFANAATGRLTSSLIQNSLKRLNGKALEELVYSKSTARTLLNPAFYLRLFSKNK